MFKAIAIAKIDSYHIISKYVELHEKERDYRGHCPFCHQYEFTLSVNRGYWYCFSCETGGHPIKFLAMIQGKSHRQVADEILDEYT